MDYKFTIIVRYTGGDLGQIRIVPRYTLNHTQGLDNMDCVWRIQNDMKVVSSLVPCLSFQNKGIVCSVNDQVVSMVTTLQYIYNRYNLEFLCKKRFLHPLYYQSSLSQSHKRTRAPLQFSLTPPTYYPVPRVDNFHHGESLLRYILSPFI